MVDTVSMDKGWSWVVLAACFGSFGLYGGLALTVGIHIRELSERFGPDVTYTSIAGAVYVALLSFSGPLSSLISDRYSCRACVMVSALLYAVGFIGTAFAQNIETCIFTFGILGGLASGIGYTAAYVIIGFNFLRKRNFAIGMAMSGTGLGLLVFPSLIELALAEYGGKMYWFMLAGISLQLFILGALMRPSVVEAEFIKARKIEGETHKGCLSLNNVVKSYVHLLKNKPMLLFCFNFLLYCGGCYTVFVHYPNYCDQRGFTAFETATLLSISGFSIIPSRALSGIASNSEDIDDLLMHSVTMGITGLLTVLLPLFGNTYVGQVIFSCGLGLYYGCSFTVMGSLKIHILGVKYLALAIGLEYFFGGIGSLVGPVLAGNLLDHGGTYEQVFIISGGCMIFAAMLGLSTTIFKTEVTSRNDDVQWLKKEHSLVIKVPESSTKDQVETADYIEPLVSKNSIEDEQML